MVPAQPIYEARKGEMPRKVGELNLDQRLSMKKEITRYLLHQEERERGQAVFRLYTILVNSSAGIAAGNSGDAAFKIYVASVQSVV